MSVENAKLLIDGLTLAGATIGGIVALVQWRRDQAWKRAEKLDSMFKEFETSRLIQIACRVLDWNRGKFSFPDGDRLEFDSSDVEKSLAVHDSGDDLTFTQTQARLRDAYDAILSFFERLEAAIDSGLVDSNQAVTLFGYWVRHMDTMPEHPNCGPKAMRYIARYGSHSSFNSLCGRLTG